MAMSQDEINQFWKTAMEAFEAKEKVYILAHDEIKLRHHYLE